jgi:uncharacterized protein
MGLTEMQWALGILGALLIGISKTGIPGTAIVAIPLMASVFGARQSVGAVLPMLIVGDVFAVTWYRRHARWDKLWGLIPWVLLGMALGGLALDRLGRATHGHDPLNTVIGVMVLVMLALSLARSRWGERLNPSSRLGVFSTGAAAGFSTTISNAAGPVMQIYFTSVGLPKHEFMGTSAWYFCIFNLIKVPILAYVSLNNPQNPVMSAHSLTFNLIIAPVIILGAFIGRWLLPRVPQKLFDTLMLVLAAVAALNMLGLPKMLFGALIGMLAVVVVLNMLRVRRTAAAL